MAESDFSRQRRLMVEFQLERRGIADRALLEAFRNVPRHLFVKSSLIDQAYEDYPLPIDDNQTISQPYIVALMIEKLKLKKDDKVLEIGTGSGYQTAILAEIADRVFTVDRIGGLVKKARQKLKHMGYSNINYRIDDGTLGWEQFAPFDAVVVSAAAPSIPLALFNQLAEKGRMVIPVGDKFSQQLQLVRKINGKIDITNYGGCTFVPLIGEQGWEHR